jgi:hypothetical protein
MVAINKGPPIKSEVHELLVENTLFILVEFILCYLFLFTMWHNVLQAYAAPHEYKNIFWRRQY